MGRRSRARIAVEGGCEGCGVCQCPYQCNIQGLFLLSDLQEDGQKRALHLDSTAPFIRVLLLPQHQREVNEVLIPLPDADFARRCDRPAAVLRRQRNDVCIR
jgi:hypothetical protein